MKKVLIQDRFSTESHIDSFKHLLERDFKDKEIELDIVFCLREAKYSVKDYHLIISPPYVFQNCCIPLVEKAIKNNVPVVFTYHSKYTHGDEIETIAQNLGINVKYNSGMQREMCVDLIRKVL